MLGRLAWVLGLGLANALLSGCGSRSGLDVPPPSSAPDAAVGPPDAAPASATQCLLLGGYGNATQTVTSTWRWDGATWTRLNPSTVPSARSDAVASALGNGAVVFGGWAYFVESYGSETTDTDQTWLWNGSDWANPSLATSPAARTYHAMAALGGKVVLFGGESSPDPLGDTWTYDGHAWTQATPAASPPARTGAVMAAYGGEIVLFGGVVGVLSGASFVNDTWSWDGSNWTQLMPRVSPPARTAATMQPLGGRLVLFGGQHVGASGSSERIHDTWAWDGDTWTELSPSASPPARAYAVSGTIGNRMFVAGGIGETQTLSDTWAFDGSTWTELPVSGPGVDELGFGSMACF